MRTTVEKAIDAARVNGNTILGACQHLNLRDSHLAKVLARYDNEYVIWTFNAEDGGFHQGHYHHTFDAAFKSFSAALYQMRIEGGI